MSRELKNVCKFPVFLGGKLRLSNLSNIKESEEHEVVDMSSENFVDKKFFFSGNSVVVEKSREISSFDVLLLLQIIEYHQKFKIESEITESDKFKYTYSSDERKEYTNYLRDYCLNKDPEGYEAAKVNPEARERFKNDVIQAKIDEDNYNKFKIYANTRESYNIKIDVADLLEARGLRNQVENRKIVEKSLRRLFDTHLVYYFLNEKMQGKIKEIKKHRHYKEWKDDVKEYFYKNKIRANMFFRHIIEDMDVRNDATEIYVKINKGFLDFCDESKYFNFSALTQLKSGAAKNFYLNACFSYKEKLSKEYVYDLMDLVSNRDDNNLSNAKKAIQELKDINFLTNESGYDTKSKMFKIYFTEIEKQKQGLVQKQNYSNKGKK